MLYTEKNSKMKKRIIAAVITLLWVMLSAPVFAAEPCEPGFTNLVIFAKFADESEFINNVYAGASVYDILDNTYNKSTYSAADYFKTVSGGKMNMQTLYLLDGDVVEFA